LPQPQVAQFAEPARFWRDHPDTGLDNGGDASEVGTQIATGPPRADQTGGVRPTLDGEPHLQPTRRRLGEVDVAELDVTRKQRPLSPPHNASRNDPRQSATRPVAAEGKGTLR
jgi:hypothetical protein